MFKKIAMAAFTAAAVAAMGQDTTTTTTTTTNGQVTSKTTDTTMSNNVGDDWRMKYDSYHIGTTDIGSIPQYHMERILKHEMRDLPAGDQFELQNFIDRLPNEQASAVLKGLVNNFKQACMVRDEVAMARYGNGESYAWLSNPPLTWAETPGQNSWTSITTTTTTNSSGTVASTTTTTDSSGDTVIAMTDDQSRPMRMVMAHSDMRDVDYDRAIGILKSGLAYSDRVIIEDLFQPKERNQGEYTNARALDAIIHLIDFNAKMADKVGRWSWYNHFDANYYNKYRQDW